MDCGNSAIKVEIIVINKIEKLCLEKNIFSDVLTLSISLSGVDDRWIGRSPLHYYYFFLILL